MKRLSGIFFVFPFFCAAFILSGCGGGSRYSGGGFASMEIAEAAAEAGAAYDSAEPQYAAQEELAAEQEGRSDLPETQERGRKLVKNAYLRVRVENLDTAEKPLAELMRKYNAWPASSSVYENSRDYSIRVPSASYDAMLAELSDFGKMLTRTENTEDVTLRYYDLEGRLATRQELLKTYQSYLARAADIEEILAVESKIAELQYEIDRTGTEFRNLANLVDYSTINVEIIGPVNAPSYSRPTIGEKLRELFASFGDTASSGLIVLVGIIIYGVPALLIAVLLFLLLFGRIGLIRKLWRLASGKKQG